MSLRTCDEHEVSYDSRLYRWGCPVCELKKEITKWENQGAKDEKEINNLCDQIFELEKTTISTKGPEQCKDCEYLSIPRAPGCIRGSGTDYCIDKERGLGLRTTNGLQAPALSEPSTQIAGNK